MKKLKVVNIEAGMPAADIAEKRLLLEINAAKHEGVAALKVIHGYGSSGVGGKIRQRVHRILNDKKRTRAIRFFISGENWSIFDEDTRRALDLYRELRQDSDLENHNCGITMVIL